jgi:uncharacterized protein YlxP (DUF503 family)
MVVRRIKDRVRERLGVFVNEVGDPEVKDSWRRGELGVAVASSERTKALALIDEVIRVAMSAGGAQITAVAKDAITFDADPSPITVVDDRTGSGDKATGSGDDGWVPAAWLQEVES